MTQIQSCYHTRKGTHFPPTLLSMNRKQRPLVCFAVPIGKGRTKSNKFYFNIGLKCSTVVMGSIEENRYRYSIDTYPSKNHIHIHDPTVYYHIPGILSTLRLNIMFLLLMTFVPNR